MSFCVITNYRSFFRKTNEKIKNESDTWFISINPNTPPMQPALNHRVAMKHGDNGSQNNCKTTMSYFCIRFLVHLFNINLYKTRPNSSNSVAELLTVGLHKTNNLIKIYSKWLIRWSKYPHIVCNFVWHLKLFVHSALTMRERPVTL